MLVAMTEVQSFQAVADLPEGATGNDEIVRLRLLRKIKAWMPMRR